MHAPLRELATVFLKLGTTAFGGPAAHIAMMEDEVVTKRQWLTREAFLDLVSASNLIPGPNSTELAIHIGWQRARWTGLLVAGLAFILPAMLIVWGIAVLYVKYGTLPVATGLLAGVKPVVLAIVLVALWRLARSAVRSAITLSLALVAFVAALSGLHELLILAGCALIAWIDGRVTRGGNHWEARGPAMAVLPSAQHLGERSASAVGRLGDAAAGVVATGAAALGFTTPSLLALFLTFAKVGSVLFGSGYVLLAFLRSDLVVRLGWLTESQLLDAIAVGQFTPGPVFTTATFAGYLVAGHLGAAVATLGIFLPAFVFVAITAPIMARWTGDLDVRRLFDGLNAASVALMAAVTIQLAPDALGWLGAGARELSSATWVARWPVMATLLFGGALGLSLRTRVNSAWLVAAGAVVGVLYF